MSLCFKVDFLNQKDIFKKSTRSQKVQSFKMMVSKASLDYGDFEGEEEIHELIDQCCMMKNRLYLKSGFSPIQRVLGFCPRIPGGVLSGGEEDLEDCVLE